MSEPRELLEAVRALADHTAAVAMQWYGKSIAVEAKGDGSPVTVADRAAEDAARAWLASHFPHDAVLGEEFGETTAAEASAAPARRWLIDPIDGTKAFVRRVPLWGSLIAVAEQGTVIAGAAAFPALGETIAAANGAGCWLNGVRCGVDVDTPLADATLLTTDDRFPSQPERAARWRTLAGQVAVTRTWGDCYGYLLVASGRAHIMVDDIVNPWDIACMGPIMREAGGVLCDFSGAAPEFPTSAIATAPQLAEAVRAALLDVERSNVAH
jgi:histidinol phosphatase-like enzyme (inositol monophosphatase family)